MIDDMGNETQPTWEWAVEHVIGHHNLDMPSKSKEPYVNLFDSGLYANLGRAAWAELNTIRGVPKWELQDQVRLMAGKQHDYGHANVLRFGADGVLVRLWDKIARYTNLKNRAQTYTVAAVNESLSDTLVDIVGYVIIYFMVLNGSFSYPLADDVVV